MIKEADQMCIIYRTSAEEEIKIWAKVSKQFL